MSIATNNKVMFSEQSVFEGITGDCRPSRGQRNTKLPRALRRRGLQPSGTAGTCSPGPENGGSGAAQSHGA